MIGNLDGLLYMAIFFRNYCEGGRTDGEKNKKSCNGEGWRAAAARLARGISEGSETRA